MLKESKKTNTEDELSVLEGIRDEIKGLKRKGAKQTAQLFFSVLLAVLVGLGGGIYCGQHWDDVMQKLFPNSYSASTTTILEEKLDKQSKLNTGIYKQVSSYDSGKIYNNSFSKKLKINSKSMTFKYTGYVEAGIKDLTSVTININSQTNVVTIDNIKIEITNVYIDPSSITDAKQSKNAFNQLKHWKIKWYRMLKKAALYPKRKKVRKQHCLLCSEIISTVTRLILIGPDKNTGSAFALLQC